MESDSKCGLEEEDIQEMSDDEEEGKAFIALCLVIKFLKKEWKELYKPWKLCLVVKLLRKTLCFQFLKARL